MDEFSKPTSWSTVRVVSLTILVPHGVTDRPVNRPQKVKRCQTLALSLEEAVARARQLYGPITLNGWGTLQLPLDPDRKIYGGGYFIPSRHDNKHRQSLQQLDGAWPPVPTTTNP